MVSGLVSGLVLCGACGPLLSWRSAEAWGQYGLVSLVR